MNDAMLDANWFGLVLCIRDGDEEQRDKRGKVHSARRRARGVTLSKGIRGTRATLTRDRLPSQVWLLIASNS